MKKIAGHDGIEIYAPDNSCFSFLKCDAFSPVDGKIIDMETGSGRLSGMVISFSGMTL